MVRIVARKVTVARRGVAILAMAPATPSARARGPRKGADAATACGVGARAAVGRGRMCTGEKQVLDATSNAMMVRRMGVQRLSRFGAVGRGVASERGDRRSSRTLCGISM